MSAIKQTANKSNTSIGHPTGITINIVGIERGDRGRSCKEHTVCGSVLCEDSVVRIRRCQIVVDGKEETAVAAYWIADGIDRCRVGFLQKHLLRQWETYEGRIAQVVDLYNGSESPAKTRKNARNYGCCEAVLIDTIRIQDKRLVGNNEEEEGTRKRQQTN
jgi:hypothetical protein